MTQAGPFSGLMIKLLLNALSVPAYLTDRLNRVRAVNRAYRELVGDPIADGWRGDELFVTSLILGPYKEKYPRRQLDVVGWAPYLPDEIEAGNLMPESHSLFKKALAQDEDVARRVSNVINGSASQKWDGLILFRERAGRYVELQETVVPLVDLGVVAGSPAFLNLWLEPNDPPRKATGDVLGVLTTRERGIASLYALGYNSRVVAGMSGISLSTARDHRDNIYGKLGVHSRIQLARRMREGPERIP